MKTYLMAKFSGIFGEIAKNSLVCIPINLLEVIAGLFYFIKVICKDISATLHSNGNQRKLTYLYIEPTNTCNANCVFCAYQYREDKSHKEIDLRLVEKLIDSFCASGGGDIDLTPTNGEPLLASHLEQVIAMCRSREKIKGINITTNGILLTREKFIRLKDAGVSRIWISMSYPDKDEYGKVYRVKQFHRLMNNLNELMLLERKNVEITLSIKTRFWRNHPFFKRAKSLGFKVNRGFYFDDWSGKVSDNLKKHGLLRRPLRGSHLPCNLLQTGPRVFASGRMSVCGCRDLDEGNSELADERIFYPFYESGDLNKVYYETIEPLRRRFLYGKPPSLCAICRHYTPEFRFASARDRLAQVFADVKAAMGFLLRLRI